MRITKLDGLRGLFSLMIVFYHYDQRLLPNYISNFFLLRESWIFVEFFFVLSGFVISYNYNTIKTKKDFFIYVIKRFSRLYPLLVFSTIFFLISEITINVYFPQYTNTPEGIWSLLLKTVDTLTFMNSTPVFGNGGGMNGPSWSISSEMISYILFGLITLLVSKRPQIVFFIILILISTILFYYNYTFSLPYDFSFLRGLISFPLGVLIHRIPFSNVKFSKHLELFVPILIIIGMYFLSTNDNRFIEILIINLIFFISIHILINTNGSLSKLLDTKLFQFLGKISYSIYLNHLIVITVFSRIIFSFFGVNKTTISELIVLSISIIIVLIYSKYTYDYIEYKGLKYLKRKLL